MSVHPPSAAASALLSTIHKASATVTPTSNEPMSPAVSALTSNAVPTKCMSVLLAIARVMASDQFGAHHPARTLVDSVQRSHHRVLQCHTAVVEIFSRLSSGISRGHVTLTVSSRSVILRSISALVLLYLSMYGRALDSGICRWSTDANSRIRNLSSGTPSSFCSESKPTAALSSLVYEEDLMNQPSRRR